MRNSNIGWTENTVNFWTGCNKVSPGCFNCYASRIIEGKGENFKILHRASDRSFYEALKWKKPSLIFTCSMSDYFHKQADPWRADAWDVIRRTPHHRWQILTKRPERILQCLPPDWGDGWDNVWLGTSIENQDYLYRASILGDIPAKTRFISAEPLIGPIDFTKDEHGKAVFEKFHWCILGGESGNDYGEYRYRECEVEWMERIINDFRGSNVKVFVKQMGTYLVREMHLSDKHGTKACEWPEHLQVQEYPDNLPNLNFKQQKAAL
jgi:protein gp37